MSWKKSERIHLKRKSEWIIGAFGFSHGEDLQAPWIILKLEPTLLEKAVYDKVVEDHHRNWISIEVVLIMRNINKKKFLHRTSFLAKTCSPESASLKHRRRKALEHWDSWHLNFLMRIITEWNPTTKLMFTRFENRPNISFKNANSRLDSRIDCSLLQQTTAIHSLKLQSWSSTISPCSVKLTAQQRGHQTERKKNHCKLNFHVLPEFV